MGRSKNTIDTTFHISKEPRDVVEGNVGSNDQSMNNLLAKKLAYVEEVVVEEEEEEEEEHDQNEEVEDEEPEEPKEPAQPKVSKEKEPERPKPKKGVSFSEATGGHVLAENVDVKEGTTGGVISGNCSWKKRPSCRVSGSRILVIL